MINKILFWQANHDTPETVVLDRLNDWRKENPDAVILGMQWTNYAQVAICEVTFEVAEEPDDPVEETA